MFWIQECNGELSGISNEAVHDDNNISTFSSFPSPERHLTPLSEKMIQYKRLCVWGFILTLQLLSVVFKVKAITPPSPLADSKTKEFYQSFNEFEWEAEATASASAESKEQTQNNQGSKLSSNSLVDLSSNKGFVRVLVLLVRFTNHGTKILPPESEINTLFNAKGNISTIIPTGSISDWFTANSYGRLRMEAEIINWTLTTNTETYFASNINTGMPAAGVTYEMAYAMYPILDQLDADGFDFSRFDGNNDGKIDLIVLLHSGFAAELGNSDCYTNATYENRIWSHATATSPYSWVSKKTGMSSSSYAVGAGIRGYCNARVPRLGVITHEMMHTFGLPDLYDNKGDWIGKGLGYFDIMSNPHGRSGAQTHPAFLSPWCKIQVEWLNPIPIECNGRYSIEASETSNQIYIIKKGYPDEEYLLIENRQPLQWDALLWNGGLLIWHIDNTGNRRQVNRGYPGQPDWPGNGNHYQIALEQADRKYDLEIGVNNGDDGDFWRDGKEYGPGPTESNATNSSLYPNSNTYKSGIVQRTGIRIFGISASNGTMAFSVEGLGQAKTPSPSGFPSESQIPSARPTMVPTLAPVTNAPTTLAPVTLAPTTLAPVTFAPSNEPTTAVPISNEPTRTPTIKPTIIVPTILPARSPTKSPTRSPTKSPTRRPTSAPSTKRPSTKRPTITPAPLAAKPRSLSTSVTAPTRNHTNDPTV